jgi:5-methylcytosine-specific restriction enzyme A
LVKIGSNWYASDESLSNSIPEEIVEPELYLEGALKKISINAYERNGKARSACIKHYGSICAACNFNFQATYGAIGKGFIHVHHIVPLASRGQEYELDPILDLIPLCPNCHAITHLTQPAMTIEELKGCVAAAKACNN